MLHVDIAVSHAINKHRLGLRYPRLGGMQQKSYALRISDNVLICNQKGYDKAGRRPLRDNIELKGSSILYFARLVRFYTPDRVHKLFG